MQLAVLAGFGADVLFRRLSAAGAGVAKGAVALTFLLLAVEYRNTGMILTDLVLRPSRGLQRLQGRSHAPDRALSSSFRCRHSTSFQAWKCHYAFASIGHWYPLVNGYSGYYPSEYSQTLSRMQRFPDDRSIAQLRNIGVRYSFFTRTAIRRGSYALSSSR